MAFGDKKREQQMTESMSAAITEGIAEAMRPVFEELTGQMKDMMLNLQNTQAESMKIMADAFLGEMKKAAGGMFADVTAGLENVCRQQEAVAKNLNEAADRIAAESKRMSEVTVSLSDAVSSIKETGAVIEKAAGEQNKAADTFASQINEYNKSSANIARTLEESQKEWVTNYNTYEEKLSDMSGKAADTAAKAADTINGAVTALETHITGLKEACEKLDASTRTYSETITHSSEMYGRKLNEGIEGTFEAFDTEMAGIARTLATAAAQISEVTVQIPRTLKGSIDELERTIKR